MAATEGVSRIAPPVSAERSRRERTAAAGSSHSAPRGGQRRRSAAGRRCGFAVPTSSPRRSRWRRSPPWRPSGWQRWGQPILAAASATFEPPWCSVCSRPSQTQWRACRACTSRSRGRRRCAVRGARASASGAKFFGAKVTSSTHLPTRCISHVQTGKLPPVTIARLESAYPSPAMRSLRHKIYTGRSRRKPIVVMAFGWHHTTTRGLRNTLQTMGQSMRDGVRTAATGRRRRHGA